MQRLDVIARKLLRHLSLTAWSSDYNGSADLHLLVAECRYLTQDLEAFNRLFNDLQNKLRTESHRSRLYELKVLIFYNRRIGERVDRLWSQGDPNVGHRVSYDPQFIIPAISAEMETIHGLMGTRKPAELLNLPR